MSNSSSIYSNIFGENGAITFTADDAAKRVEKHREDLQLQYTDVAKHWLVDVLKKIKERSGEGYCSCTVWCTTEGGRVIIRGSSLNIALAMLRDSGYKVFYNVNSRGVDISWPSKKEVD